MNDNRNILSALGYLDVAQMSREEWIEVGMALKEEGFDVSVWDEWSRNDSRYHPGECQRTWNSFKGGSRLVRGGSIVMKAKELGWSPMNIGADGELGWDDYIEYDGDGVPHETPWDPCADLKKYLEALFEPEDVVGYVTNDVWQKDGKWIPTMGVYDRTAGELVASLEKHPKDIGMTIGDCRPEAGGWIRFNPLDGQGVKNENVADFKYALVESDDLPLQEQEAVYRKLELPIAAMVASGNKSIHAIVKVEAADYDEYRKRVQYLYDFMASQGVKIDTQNRNPSRLSRIPGVLRNGKRQYLIATDIGRKSWVDWMDFAEGVTDEMPEIGSFDEVKDNLPELPEELIEGILRRGHKMLISGSSKAGKSFLLLELAIAIAEGKKWLGFPCRKGRVLYINLEIDPASFLHRIDEIYKALSLEPRHAKDVLYWNLRGHALPMDQLAPKIIRKVRDLRLDAIIIDPIYKVITGDENNASEMGAFCNRFDDVATETGCSVIYCHHHSKGSQGMKKAMDRASGSGVFARDPDAQLDMIELVLTQDIKDNLRDNVTDTAWRLETSLREFANITPVNFWFKHPVHVLDDSRELAELGAEGSQKGNLDKSGKRTTKKQRREMLDKAYDICSIDPPVRVADMAEYADVDEKTIRRYIKEFSDGYKNDRGVVVKLKTDTGTDTKNAMSEPELWYQRE